MDNGFEAIKVTVSNHATDTSSKLEQFRATNAEMTDNWIQSSEVCYLLPGWGALGFISNVCIETRTKVMKYIQLPLLKSQRLTIHNQCTMSVPSPPPPPKFFQPRLMALQ